MRFFPGTALVILGGCLLSFTLPGCARQLPAPVRTPQLTAEAVHLVASADSLATARRYQEAAERYTAALALAPDSLVWARRALGVFWRAARYDEAYTWGMRVLAQDPDSRQVLFNVSVTCGFLVELECMESMFRRALHIDPTYVLAHGELAFLAYGRGDLPAAISHMERGHVIAPADELAASGLAQMLIPAGEATRAVTLLERHVATNRRARAYGGRSMLTLYGWALLALGDTLAAHRAFDEVLGWLRDREQAGETTYQLFRERAAIHALRGDRDAAIADLLTAFDRGWRLYGAWTLIDPMLVPLRDDPAVLDLTRRMRQDVLQQRARLGLPVPADNAPQP